MYVMVQGHLAADDELFLRPENSDPYALPYRTMRATNLHTLLKFKAGYEVIKDMLPALRRDDCLLIGVGKSAPDPIKRGGIHLFALALKGPNDEVINVKTRVPNEFLKLVRGGVPPSQGRVVTWTNVQPRRGTPQSAPPRTRRIHASHLGHAQKSADSQRENRRSTQSRSVWASSTGNSLKANRRARRICVGC